MTIETSVDALTTQTTALLEVCEYLRNSTAQRIETAVMVSENAALVPLITMASNLITTQAMLVPRL